MMVMTTRHGARERMLYILTVFPLSRTRLCRCGGPKDAQVLFIWRYCQHSVTDGVEWRGLVFYSTSACDTKCHVLKPGYIYI